MLKSDVELTLSVLDGIDGGFVQHPVEFYVDRIIFKRERVNPHNHPVLLNGYRGYPLTITKGDGYSAAQ